MSSVIRMMYKCSATKSTAVGSFSSVSSVIRLIRQQKAIIVKAYYFIPFVNLYTRLSHESFFAVSEKTDQIIKLPSQLYQNKYNYRHLLGLMFKCWRTWNSSNVPWTKAAGQYLHLNLEWWTLNFKYWKSWLTHLRNFRWIRSTCNRIYCRSAKVRPQMSQWKDFAFGSFCLKCRSSCSFKALFTKSFPQNKHATFFRPSSLLCLCRTCMSTDDWILNFFPQSIIGHGIQSSIGISVCFNCTCSASLFLLENPRPQSHLNLVFSALRCSLVFLRLDFFGSGGSSGTENSSDSWLTLSPAFVVQSSSSIASSWKISSKSSVSEVLFSQMLSTDAGLNIGGSTFTSSCCQSSVFIVTSIGILSDSLFHNFSSTSLVCFRKNLSASIAISLSWAAFSKAARHFLQIKTGGCSFSSTI